MSMHISNVERTNTDGCYVKFTDGSFIIFSHEEINTILSNYSPDYNKATKELVPNRTGDDEMDEFVCPTCNETLCCMEEYDFVDTLPRYCRQCGQKLSWRNPFNNGKVVR